MRNLDSLTQNQKLVRYFVRFKGEVTAAQAAARYGIQNLRARINDLRNFGLAINTEMRVNTETGARVAFYSMDEKIVA